MNSMVRIAQINRFLTWLWQLFGCLLHYLSSLLNSGHSEADSLFEKLETVKSLGLVKLELELHESRTPVSFIWNSIRFFIIIYHTQVFVLWPNILFQFLKPHWSIPSKQLPFLVRVKKRRFVSVCLPCTMEFTLYKIMRLVFRLSTVRLTYILFEIKISVIGKVSKKPTFRLSQIALFQGSIANPPLAMVTFISKHFVKKWFHRQYTRGQWWRW